MQPTKWRFLEAYRTALLNHAAYDHWTKTPSEDPSRQFHEFMSIVTTTLFTPSNAWDLDSEIARHTWRAIGGPGKLTYKAIRALPDGEKPKAEAVQ